MELSKTVSTDVISKIINTSILQGNGSTMYSIQFPINKIQTRLKHKAGKNRRIKHVSVYDVSIPIPRTLMKSPPPAAAFFGVYSKAKPYLERHAYSENLSQSLCHILAVYLGNTASCMVRVPIDMIKQQAKIDKNLHTFQLINKLICSEGIFTRLYRQLKATTFRELPFCSIQIPMWEFLKIRVEKLKNGNEIKPYESGICGALSGATAAAITMPIDVAHKRVNVEKKGTQYPRFNILQNIRDIAQEQGVKSMFNGVLNRGIMMGFGSLLFFGCYEQKKKSLIVQD